MAVEWKDRVGWVGATWNLILGSIVALRLHKQLSLLISLFKCALCI